MLESLPNEVLLELFTNYMQGIDVLVGFADLNHQRFNGIIAQCSRFSLDFHRCRKTHFRSCLGLLRNAGRIEKVEELILSEQNTPGQINEFFSVFPSFAPFTQLQRLYLYIHVQWIDWPIVTVALQSLSAVPIETISIDHITTNSRRQLHIPMDDILNLSTLKRLSFVKDHSFNRWSSPAIRPSGIKYLKYTDMSAEMLHNFELLQYIPQLKYLDVQLSERSFFRSYYLSHDWDRQLNPFAELRTLILTVTPYDLSTLDSLKDTFKRMPALQRLEVTANHGLLVAEAWEELFKTSLPSLTYFRLKATKSHLTYSSIDTILDSFETPFWQEKENFYLIITDYRRVSSSGFYFLEDRTDDRKKSSQAVIKWWIVPKRARKDDVPTKDMITLGITTDFKYLSDYYYFQNVKHLIIYHLDAKLVECILTSVNCFGIEHLDVSAFDHQSNAIPLLLSHLDRIVSLRIQHQHLVQYQEVYSRKLTSIKYLDISIDPHRFSGEDISMISRLFPQLNHLAINVWERFMAPLLRRYLPNLWSLTYVLRDRGYLPLRTDQQDQFLINQDDQWRTVWIDDQTLDNS